MEWARSAPSTQDPSERTRHWLEFYNEWSEREAREQGGRCMNCSVPFCMGGCPLGNIIPDFNDLVYRGKWREALHELHSTNNFPEFTGRICPAPCEGSCVLNINDDPVTIEYVEKAISDRGWQEGWIVAEPPRVRTGKSVAIIGSGPAGLAAAMQLNRVGHSVTVFERDEYVGGLLRLGIPEFKLEKTVVQRRVDQMTEEGVTFKTGIYVGQDVPVADLRSEFDAICLTGGSTVARDLPIPGRELGGVHLAMEYLTQQNRVNEGQTFGPSERIVAEGKRVLVLGGGDTGSDCVGTAHRQGAEVVYQFELLPEPPLVRRDDNPWPQWPVILRTSSSHEEGAVRDYNILTKSFSGSNGTVQKMHAVRLDWGQPDRTGRPAMIEIEDSEFDLDVDLVLLALGFVHPEKIGMLDQLGVDLDARGNVVTDADKMTTVPGVFAAGDMARGQSLVVWALAEGREAARGIDQYLMGSTKLPHSVNTVPAM